jgi:hypothetical protein
MKLRTLIIIGIISIITLGYWLTENPGRCESYETNRALYNFAYLSASFRTRQVQLKRGPYTFNGSLSHNPVLKHLYLTGARYGEPLEISIRHILDSFSSKKYNSKTIIILGGNLTTMGLETLFASQYADKVVVFDSGKERITNIKRMLSDSNRGNVNIYPFPFRLIRSFSPDEPSREPVGIVQHRSLTMRWYGSPVYDTLKSFFSSSSMNETGNPVAKNGVNKIITTFDDHLRIGKGKIDRVFDQEERFQKIMSEALSSSSSSSQSSMQSAVLFIVDTDSFTQNMVSYYDTDTHETIPTKYEEQFESFLDKCFDKNPNSQW